MKRVDFCGIECLEIANERLSLLVSVSLGPRVLSFKPRDGENLFAFLPGASLDCPGAGVFHFHGGHRLWVAPEDPCLTYLPDDDAVRFEPLEGGVRLTRHPHAHFPVEKLLEIRLASEGMRVEVRHFLHNCGSAPLRLAPWAITQFKPGGIAILPLAGLRPDESPVLPNRSLALWPYTDLGGEWIRWGNSALLVSAKMTGGMFKIGYPNPAGWMGYWKDGTLFVKRAAFQLQAEYLDMGSSTECYCDPRFLELETLGPVTWLEPGRRVEHAEVWSIHRAVRWTDDLAEVRAAVEEG